ncbi:hypothetical protein GGGNBK_11600 [Sporosarcina sp. ANT_H38]|uniref:hypothetical protein n=1 Tax=Sporosarcina sp. ANT_H38 TaxID=2597358 RepID=UPI00351A4CE0
MTNITMNVLFKKMQKDDKKEVLEFHILGDSVKYKNELIGMAGGIVVLHIEDTQFNAEFKSIQRDSKKICLKFDVKGDNEEKTLKLYPKAGHNVNLTLEESQMSLEEFDMDEHEGIKVKANGDGTIEVVEGQIRMEDIQIEETALIEEDELPFGIQQEESPFVTGEAENLPFEIKVEDLKNEDDLLE